MVNFHNKPFDDGTIVKLELFGRYAEAWIPVFVSQANRAKVATIVDFFAGPGMDKNGQSGSPLLILDQIAKYEKEIEDSGVEVRLILNEVAKKKAAALRTILENRASTRPPCKVDVTSQVFDESFETIRPRLLDGPNLLFLDQQGIKFISDEVFTALCELPKTDFIFFIASSFIGRFADHPAFKSHIEISKKKISAGSFNNIHRVVTDHYRGLISSSRSLFIAQFSIKKGSNIYGLIFGSQHPKGIEKFLRICWSIDPDRGEANFDIDAEDVDSRTPHLFPEMDQTKKLQVFQTRLRRKILDGSLGRDRDVYLECLREGMLPKHGRPVLRELQRSGLVAVPKGKQARVSITGFNDPRLLEVKKDGAV